MARWRSRWSLEIALFAALAPSFFTVGNFFEITRLSVELGLLAIALTPVIVAGGIDLSVGAMLGLAAVDVRRGEQRLGRRCRSRRWRRWPSARAGGALNALLIAWLDIPPLIVTLGSLSLFRGIAEGMTRGGGELHRLPARFPGARPGLSLGRGPGAAAAVRRGAGRLRDPAAPVGRRPRALRDRLLARPARATRGFRCGGASGSSTCCPGWSSSVAAIIYVAHLGQARSDAGNGYELDAITAVVLGGTSVFGGRGTLWGTVLGLFAISVLRNGLQLAALPTELAGVLTGGAAPRDDCARPAAPASPADDPPSLRRKTVKNSQVAVLCATIVAGALIVAGTNVWLVRSLQPAGAPAGGSAAAAARPLPADAAGDRDDAEGEGRSVFHQLPRGRRGGRARSSASS